VLIGGPGGRAVCADRPFVGPGLSVGFGTYAVSSR